MENHEFQTGYIEKLPAVLAGFSGIALLLSVVHEYAYYFVIGDRFLATLTALDFLRLAIYWLPVPIVTFLVGAILGQYLRAHRDQLELRLQSAPASSFELPTFLPKEIDFGVMVTAVVSIIFAIFLFLLFPESPTILIGPIYLICSFLAAKAAKKINKSKISKQFFLITFIFAPSFLCFSFLKGIQDAYSDLRRVEPLYVLDETNSSSKILLLRASEKGVLIRDPNTNMISFKIWNGSTKVSLYRVLDKKQSGFQYLKGLFE
jgi:hypothetical protein